MFFPIFFAAARSFFPFQSPVIKCDGENWVNEVLDYVEKGVVFAIFVKKRSPKTNAVVEDFQIAANKSDGMIKFVSVDIEKNPKIAFRYTVRQAPSFRIISSEGAFEYKDEISADSFIKASTKYIKSRCQIVDATWGPSVKTPPEAILITNKKVTPPYWAAISNAYTDTTARIGVCRNPDIASLFGVTEQNCIVFVSNNFVSVYSGQLTYSAIIKAFEEFIKNPVSSGGESSLIGKIGSREKFNNFCHNTGKVCVIIGNNEATEAFKEVAENNRDDRFKFYTCGESCPFGGMEGGIYIFHYKKDRAMKVEDEKSLPIALDHVADGTARYTPFLKLFKLNEDL
jgi:hypothetical protein